MIPDATVSRRRTRSLRRRALAGARRVVGVAHRAALSSTARLAGPPSAATGIKDGSAFLTVGSTAPLFSEASETQLTGCTPSPPRRQDRATGGHRTDQPRQREAITSRLPLVLAIIAGITLVLLFLLTGSVVLPLKALLLNVCR